MLCLLGTAQWGALAGPAAGLGRAGPVGRVRPPRNLYIKFCTMLLVRCTKRYHIHII